MSENQQNNAATDTAPGVNVDEVAGRLAKHMERLPWAASRLTPASTPAQLQQFIVDWVVPLLTDTHHVALGSYYLLDEMTERLDEQDEIISDATDSLGQQVEAGLAMARNTLMGEALSLLHMHFKTLHGHLLTKLQPNDPASFALTEMHEVFVRIGVEAPVGTPRSDAENISDDDDDDEAEDATPTA